MQQIGVQARAEDLCGSVIDSLSMFADGVNSAHKGIIEKHTKSGGIHDWAKEKLSLYQSS